MSLAEDEKGIPCESVTEAAAVFFRIDRKVYVFFATHCHWIFWEDVAKKEISQKTCRLIRIYACGTSGSNQIRLIFYLVSMTVISYGKVLKRSINKKMNTK